MLRFKRCLVALGFGADYAVGCGFVLALEAWVFYWVRYGFSFPRFDKSDADDSLNVLVGGVFICRHGVIVLYYVYACQSLLLSTPYHHALSEAYGDVRFARQHSPSALG